MNYREYLDALAPEDRASLVRARKQRQRENVGRRQRGEPPDLMPSILTDSDNPLVEATCCGRRTSADMVSEVEGRFVCDRCRPRGRR